MGTGDYGQLTIDHAPMLMRRFFTVRDYRNEGFEASHKGQRQMYLCQTSHDAAGDISSSM